MWNVKSAGCYLFTNPVTFVYAAAAYAGLFYLCSRTSNKIQTTMVKTCVTFSVDGRQCSGEIYICKGLILYQQSTKYCVLGKYKRQNRSCHYVQLPTLKYNRIELSPAFFRAV